MSGREINRRFVYVLIRKIWKIQQNIKIFNIVLVCNIIYMINICHEQNGCPEATAPFPHCCMVFQTNNVCMFTLKFQSGFVYLFNLFGGIGLLAVPKAFSEAGLPLSIITLTLLAFVRYNYNILYITRLFLLVYECLCHFVTWHAYGYFKIRD